MLQHLIDIDTSVYLFFNSLHSSYFDRLMMLLTGKYAWIAMYASLVYVMFRQFGWRKAIVVVLAVVLSIVVADQTCATFIRPAVERLRPSHVDNPLSALAHLVDGYRGGNYGFPSCHAANSFALALITSLFVRRAPFTIFMFAWAFLHSYTRLYLGVHYPGDLLVGAIIGSLGAYIVYLLASLLLRHIPSASPSGSVASSHPNACYVAIAAGLLTLVVLIFVAIPA